MGAAPWPWHTTCGTLLPPTIIHHDSVCRGDDPADFAASAGTLVVAGLSPRSWKVTMLKFSSVVHESCRVMGKGRAIRAQVHGNDTNWAVGRFCTWKNCGSGQVWYAKVRPVLNSEPTCCRILHVWLVPRARTSDAHPRGPRLLRLKRATCRARVVQAVAVHFKT